MVVGAVAGDGVARGVTGGVWKKVLTKKGH